MHVDDDDDDDCCDSESLVVESFFLQGRGRGRDDDQLL